MRVLGLIPARGGSKGIARKNVRLLGGKPLLQWTIDAALSARTLTRVVLSTEDDEIAAIGRARGVSVPFLRPPALAADDTATLPVVQHAIRALEELNDRFDAVCLLQPTNPFRTPSDIDCCVRLLQSSGGDSVLAMLPVPAEFNPHWVYFRDEDGTLRLSTGESQPLSRRQLLPPAFHREGSVYVTRRDVIMEKNSLYGSRVFGYEIARSNVVNIDSQADWDRAEAMLKGAMSRPALR